ncbi:AmmeMemoRadiSam system protein B [Desulfobotulus sp. H1]|uniref:MEMO1 family protein OOT00_01755 n=1 Tax=Desulfobotulus pelophilus TaxID=2823377 RepID=A0ABT3N5G9_9BACT|nr:AmmeMemoRadiSam system protein B [Desulfobotulus pelophilus]MCW7752708.1 AmmeMemoRadiSam system protein B [Desulfobotulus pelophilus]
MDKRTGRIRQPAVASLFYPKNADDLRKEVRMLMDKSDDFSFLRPKALVVPHAGYAYSGALAAVAYRALSERKDSVHRVVLLGPAHRVYLRGMALSTSSFFATPLGKIPVEKEEQLFLKDGFPWVRVMDTAHAMEHSLEVQLPFLQVALGPFTLLPILVGATSQSDVAAVLDSVWGGAETLVVISSDLSHFLDYDCANRLDTCTAEAIESLDPGGIGREAACGLYPLKGFLAVAGARGMTVHRLGLCNSGDVTDGMHSNGVVGYGAWAFMEKEG